MVNDSNPLNTCTYNSPLIGYPISGKTWGIVQTNCHHWDCPLHGPLIARLHYGQIVAGTDKLNDKTLYLITLTSKGSGLSLQEAQDNYYQWTNRLLSALRFDAKRNGLDWYYVQVLERQKRGHPHSHILTTYCPIDIVVGKKHKYKTVNGKRVREYYDTLVSVFFERVLNDSGLGSQYDIQVVRSNQAVSRYIAKYLFKDTSLTAWPRKWKRVRYSRNWPKLPSMDNPDAILLGDFRAWRKLSHEAISVTVNSDDKKVMDRVLFALYDSDVLINAGNVTDTIAQWQIDNIQADILPKIKLTQEYKKWLAGQKG